MTDGIDTSAYMDMFLDESREHLQQLGNAILRIEKDPADRKTIDEVFRIAHSFKGMSATMGFDRIAALAHRMEEVIEVLRANSGELPRDVIDVLLACLDTLERMIEQVAKSGTVELDAGELIARLGRVATAATSESGDREASDTNDGQDELDQGDLDLRSDAADGPGVNNDGNVVAATVERRANSSVRVDSERLDGLLHLIGEMAVHRSSVEDHARRIGDPELIESVSELTRASQSVQEMVMRVRMIPIDAVFARLPRLVRDLSKQLGKSVVLELTGSETELDRTAVDTLGDPLVHLVRNAIDHGIEHPDARLATGKEATGRLRISARHAGGDVVISVSDDGSGISASKVAAAAVKRGLISADEAAAITDPQALELVFMSGFSTSDKATDISGRGVGMDAVRATVRGFGGDVVVSTVEGEGTVTELRMPLTLAIMPALLVESDGRPYAIQLDRIDRIHEFREVTVRRVGGRPTVVLDDRALPILNIGEAFNRTGDAGEPKFMVIVRSADRQLALAVDDLVGQRELVTRAVPQEVRGDAPIAGGAVLPDGGIALIVDCDALSRYTSERRNNGKHD